MMITDQIGLYVHIPFCKSKCNYCDFTSFSGMGGECRAQYIKRLKEEILGYKRTPKIKINTIFFGGGTPSLLSEGEMTDICESIKNSFDVSEKLIGTTVAGKEILPLSQLEDFVKEHKISIGIITVPKVAAQDVLNKMVGAGIKAIWNFAPAPLRVPKDIVLKTEDLAASLAMLAGKLYKLHDE